MKKVTLFKVGMFFVSVSGGILTAQANIPDTVKIPNVFSIVAGVAGAIGTGILAIDRQLKKAKENE